MEDNYRKLNEEYKEIRIHRYEFLRGVMIGTVITSVIYSIVMFVLIYNLTK
jgi:hypothetical protein